MKNKVFVNSQMALGILIYSVITTVLCFGIILDLETDTSLTKNETDRLSIQIMFIVMIILLNLSLFISCVPRWFVIIEFAESGLYIIKPFQKKSFISYSNIRQITIATYNHIGKFPKYIVFSTRKLSKYEKTHVNLIDDEKVIILRYRKKVLDLIEKYRLQCTGDGSLCEQ